MSHVIGIDLGTTNSLVGGMVDGKPKLFPGSDGNVLLPSVVGFDEAGQLLIGRPAKNRRLVDPERTIVEVKRSMGKNQVYRPGDRELSPAHISALILGALVDRAEMARGERPDRAIITVPAYFGEAQREATRDAGEIAGLHVERLVNEPTAAAIRYQTGSEQNVLVYDFGGGTFDVSVLERDEGFLEVKSSRGDVELGGGDVDRAIVHWLLERLDAGRAAVQEDPRAMTRLVEAAERAKIALSRRDEVRLYEPFLTGEGAGAVHLDDRLTQNDLAEIVRPFIERTLTSVDEALRDAALPADALDRVLLVGGSSLLLGLADRVAEHLGRPVIVSDDVDQVVALGASVLAGRASGFEVDEVLVDITPHTLSAGAVSDYDGHEDLVACPVISRDTVVPAERTETYYTREVDQPAVQIPIVQGEERRVIDNTPLGEVVIDDLPPGPALAPVHVTFALDLSGVLHVEATHGPSGRSARVSIANSPYRLTELRREEAKEMVQELREQGPCSDSAPQEAARAAAQALLARAEAAIAAAERSSSADTEPSNGAEAEPSDKAVAQAHQARERLAESLRRDADTIDADADALADALLDLV